MRRRTLLTALLLTSGCLVAPPAPTALAQRSGTFSVTAAWASSSVYTGDKAVLSGKISPVKRTKQIAIQLKDAGVWTTVAHKSISSQGKYRYVVTPSEEGTYPYRAKMPKVGTVRSGTSPVRTLTVTLNPIVTFTIPPNSAGVPWNSQESPVVAQVGQTLRIINGDTDYHLLHSKGPSDGPFPHPSVDSPIPPGGSADYLIQTAFSGSLYCHYHANTNEKFWITVTDPA